MRTVTLTLSLTLLALGAEAAPGPSRADKAAVLDWFRSNLVDPYSIRSPGISAPAMVRGGNGPVMAVCVEYNARNQVGGYTGIDRIGFLVTPTGLNRPIRSPLYSDSCYDPAVVMQPFPELGRIK